MIAPSSSPRLSRFAGIAVRCVAAVAMGVNARWRAFYGRRTARQLLELDDYMLRDIGITRGDVHAALSSPTPTDPTVRLRILAVERRAGRRAAQREAAAETGLLDALLESRRASLPAKDRKAPTDSKAPTRAA